MNVGVIDVVDVLISVQVQVAVRILHKLLANIVRYQIGGHFGPRHCRFKLGTLLLSPGHFITASDRPDGRQVAMRDSHIID